MKKIKYALLFAGLVVAAPALADQEGLFIGGMVGKAESKEQSCSLDLSLPCDRKDTAWSGNVGWMFNQNWGMEAAYNNLGRVVDQNDQALRSSNARVRAGSLVAIGSYSIEKVSLYLKAGGYRAKTDLTSSYLPEGSSKNNGWLYGVGLRYDLWSHLALRAEWQRFNNIGGGAVGFRADVDMITGGVLLTF